jgi:hypothetical protein
MGQKKSLSINPENTDQPYSAVPGQLAIKSVKNENTQILPDMPFQFISLRMTKDPSFILPWAFLKVPTSK